MRLPTELVLLLPLALSAPLSPRSVDFPSLIGLTPLDRDLSTTDSRRPDKYFHESVLHPHYDGRFASTILPPNTRLFHMRLLLATYMRTAARAHVRTWIMHGSLLGWWWNGRIMPWDSDIDVQVDEAGMRELAGWWNMTVHSFSAADLGLVDDSSPSAHRAAADDFDPVFFPRINGKPHTLHETQWSHVLDHGKKYLLEINPHATNQSTRDRHNVIDARWIDVSTGLFIDITTVHAVVPTASPHTASADDDADDDDYLAFEGDDAHHAQMYTKDMHLYPRAALFPLRETTFEGVPVRVPYAYEALLLDEYSKLALTETWYRGYAFKNGEWDVAPRDS